MEILAYEYPDPTKPPSKVIGYVDLKVRIEKPVDLIFRKIAHLSNEGKSWLNFASFPRLSSDGFQKYLRYAEFAEAQYNTKLLEKAIDGVKKYLEEVKPHQSMDLTQFETLPF